jgi:phosphate transport system substrate-binding protein
VRRLRHSLPLLGAIAVLAACGSADDPLEGRVGVTGSTTLLPFVSALSGRFAERHPDVSMNVRMTGTGDGLALLCDGLAPISGASRAIGDRERVLCEASGVRFVGLEVARDAVVLVVGPESGLPTCLSLEQVYALLGPESANVATWAEADEVVPGSGEGLPSTAIGVSGPGSTSGTRAVLLDLAIAPFAEQRGVAPDVRGDYVAESSEQLIVGDVLRAPGNVGVAGLATAASWGDRVRLLEIDGGAGCVPPDPAAVADGRYPLSRPLLLYVDARAAVAEPAVAAFVDEALTDGGLALAAETGGATIGAEAAAEQRRRWEAALASAREEASG